MRSRSPRPLRHRLVGTLAGLAGAALLAACMPAAGEPGSTGSWRIDVGGAHADWYPDTNHEPSPLVNVGDADLRTSSTGSSIDLSHPSVPEGTPEAVYRTQRAVRPGAPMRWTLPTGGAETIRLHFAETRERFSVPGGTVTDVVVDGRIAIDDLDVYAEVGADRALVKEVPVSGASTVVELRAVSGWPSLAAIEVVGAGSGAPTPPTTPKPTTPPTTKPTTPPTDPGPSDPDPSGRRLAFAPPALHDPTTIEVSASNRALRLQDGRDYIIKMPSTPLDASGGLNINGGRNVVLIGGHIHFSQWYTGASIGKVNRGLYLQNQTGTLHIEGLLISGHVGEGIDLSQTRGAVVQLQNIRIEGATGTKEGNHADLIQSWAGPRKLLIDGFSGVTSYQGFFLLPNQWYDGPAPELFDFRNVNLTGDPAGAGYLYWVDETRGRIPVRHENLWAKPSTAKAGKPDQFLWPRPSTGDTTWNGVREGTPPGGDIVTRDSAGIGYRSPGYQR